MCYTLEHQKYSIFYLTMFSRDSDQEKEEEEEECVITENLQQSRYSLNANTPSSSLSLSISLSLFSPKLRMSFIVFSTEGRTLMKLTEDR